MSRASRHETLVDLMDKSGLGAIALRQSSNFAWYADGADNRVNQAAPLGAATVLVTREAEYVIANNIEAPRLHREEVPDIEVAEHPWYGSPVSTISELSAGVPVGTDFGLEGAEDVASAVAKLRQILDADTLERYRDVGRETQAAVDETVDSLCPGVNEDEVGALLDYFCRRRGLHVPVALIAADDRVASYRHPIPQRNTAHKQLMFAVCAERYGLHASATRFVHFEEPPDDQKRRQEACELILSRMKDEATRTDGDLSEAFRACQQFYGEAGFPEGWKLHHQGGITGYGSREVIAGPGVHTKIRVGQAFAWNPSLPMAKAEETFLLTENGPEVVAS